jgi:murein DD-endopeptidase MepM/ murein hydrolase activator NlpD
VFLVKTGISMRAQFFLGILCGVALAAHADAQVVEIARASHPAIVQVPTAKTIQAKATKKVEQRVAAQSVKATVPAKPSVTVQAAKKSVAKNNKKEPSEKKDAAHSKITIADMRKAGEQARERVDEEIRVQRLTSSRVASTQRSKPTAGAYRSSPRPREREESIFSRSSSNMRMETAFLKLADGFDFPVGKPDAQGFYKAQGFKPHHHLGEDWDGVGGGDTDLGDPIYSIGDGVVVFARDCHQGWGNVVIIRHVFRDQGTIHSIDSFYAHLRSIRVRRGEAVRRGQEIATMGTAHGLYDAHLHFEIRKNIEIGMSRAKFAQDLRNYYVPSQFILSHRHLSANGGKYRVAMNTFTHDAKIRWDRLRNYSHAHTGGGSRESSYALKKALASRNSGR